jgi:hypothetical protein
LEDGYEAECKKIYQHVERLYTSCLEDLNMWMKQYDKLCRCICVWSWRKMHDKDIPHQLYRHADAVAKLPARHFLVCSATTMQT